ncbi:hypothetical protein PO124_30375 [Bacillus licheniformis]|nr:hypothetical protein [Bacillus licheniformis]
MRSIPQTVRFTSRQNGCGQPEKKTNLRIFISFPMKAGRSGFSCCRIRPMISARITAFS